ncbi:sigma-70 family RNA polymerase sigma factor [Haloechinothrix sp. LS1_15]|nr:sigma-70 family RNA polymerase sigma factor [Haloechinothrix sp. LS1_15]
MSDSAVAGVQPFALGGKPEQADGTDVLAGLAADAAGGHPQAINDLLARIQPKVVRYCRARVGRTHCAYASADDVAQEALLGLVHSLPRYQASGSSILAFAYGIASRKVADFYRKRAADRDRLVAEFPDTPSTDSGPDSAVLTAETSVEIAQLLAVLTPQQHEILSLRIVVGLSVEETAQAVSSTPGAVRVAQHRALKRLRDYLDSANDSWQDMRGLRGSRSRDASHGRGRAVSPREPDSLPPNHPRSA